MFIFAGFMANVFHEGDRLLVIHSHELQLPALPREYNQSAHEYVGGTGVGA